MSGRSPEPILAARRTYRIGGAAAGGVFMQRIRSIALVAAFSILAGCGGGGGVAGPGGGGGGGGGGNNCPTNNVCMTAGSFSPTTLTVTKGTTVTFNNNSSTTHTVVFDAPLPEAVVDIGTMVAAATATRTLGTAGTYAFHCTIHAGMSGTVVVQ